MSEVTLRVCKHCHVKNRLLPKWAERAQTSAGILAECHLCKQVTYCVTVHYSDSLRIIDNEKRGIKTVIRLFIAVVVVCLIIWFLYLAMRIIFF